MSDLEAAQKNVDTVNHLVEVLFRLEQTVSADLNIPNINLDPGSKLAKSLHVIRIYRAMMLKRIPEVQAYALLAQNEAKNDLASLTLEEKQ